jgi:hypothetical protein
LSVISRNNLRAIAVSDGPVATNQPAVPPSGFSMTRWSRGRQFWVRIAACLLCVPSHIRSQRAQYCPKGLRPQPDSCWYALDGHSMRYTLVILMCLM